MPKKPLIIGLTGTNASGKGIIADYLKKRGFAYHSLSDVIREELTKNRIDITRANLIEAGNNLRVKFGPSILAKRIMARMSDQNTVIDSLRNRSEVLELKRFGNFILIAVDAPIGIRFKRALDRGRAENAKTVEEFEALEKREASKNSNHQQIDQCIKMADIKMVNDGTIEELYEKIAKIIKKYQSN